MSLIDLITQIDGYAAKTPAEVRTALLAERRTPLGGSAKMWNYDRVRSEFSVQLAEGIHFGLIAQGLTGAAASFTANGLDATHQSWLDNADVLKANAQNPPDDATFTRLKYAGFSVQPSLWAAAFPEAASPTTQEVSAVLASIAADAAKAELISGWRERFDAAMNKLGAPNQAAGVTDLRAIADEMEAS